MNWRPEVDIKLNKNPEKQPEKEALKEGKKPELKEYPNTGSDSVTWLDKTISWIKDAIA